MENILLKKGYTLKKINMGLLYEKKIMILKYYILHNQD